MRINAEFLTLLGKEHAIFFQDKLKEMGVETLEDKMLRVKILKKLHRDKEAVAELEKLLRTEPNSVPWPNWRRKSSAKARAMAPCWAS